MASKGMAIAVVVLRIFTILFAVGCVVVLTLVKATKFDGSKVTFKDFITYRYVLATTVIGAAYSMLQLPFATYLTCTGKRLIRGGFLPAFDFYGDKVIIFLLASGVGAGFLVTVELKDFLSELFKEYLAAGFLARAFLCMAFLSMFSSPQRTTTGSKGFFR